MKENSNIEDVFRKAAEKYKVEPGDRVWNNVEKEIWNTNFFNRLHEILNKYHVMPNAEVWQTVQRRLAYLMFFRFTWTTFNVYYASAILLIAGSIFVLDGSSDQTKVSGNSAEMQIAELNLERKVISNKSVVKNNEVLTTLVLGLNDDNRNIEKVEINEKPQSINNISNEELASVIITADNLSIAEEKEVVEVTDNNVDNKTNSIQNTFEEIIENDLSNEKTNDLLIENEINSIENPIVVNDELAIEEIHDNLNNDSNNSNSEITVTIADNILTQDSDFSQNVFPEDIANEDNLKNDSLILPEVIIPYKDTVGKDAMGNDIIIETTHWSADLFYQPFVSQMKYKSENPELEYNVGLRNIAEQRINNMKSFGMHANYSFKQLFVQTGLSYTVFETSSVLNTTMETVEVGLEQAIFPTSYYSIDTYTFLNLDSLLVGVEHQITVNDTLWQTGMDTFMYVVYDTTSEKRFIETTGRYSYIEVPLIFGYEFQHRNFTITPKVGLLAGVQVKTGGFQPGLSDFSVPSGISKDNYKQWQLSAYFSVGISYKISKRFEVIADPFYRISLNSMLKEESGTEQKMYGTGIKLGLRYFFNE